MKKEKVIITVQIVMQNYLALNQNLIVVLVGLHLQKLFREPLKLRQTIHLEWKELSIIAQIVELTTDMYLRMAQVKQVKDFVITVFV